MQNLYKASLFLILCTCLIMPLSIHAEHSSHLSHSRHGFWIGEPGSGEAMLVDALVARPIGLVTTVVGSTVYVISLPFSLLGGNEKQARQKLVVEPTEFTFKRPLGEFRSREW